MAWDSSANPVSIGEATKKDDFDIAWDNIVYNRNSVGDHSIVVVGTGITGISIYMRDYVTTGLAWPGTNTLAIYNNNIQTVLFDASNNVTFAGNIIIPLNTSYIGIDATTNFEITSTPGPTLNGAGGVTIAIDTNNNSTTAEFAIYKDATGRSGTEIFKIIESGNATFAGDILIPDGSAAAPSIHRTAEETGFYFATDAVVITHSGVWAYNFAVTALDIAAGKVYSIGGASVITAIALGSGVIASSLTSLGTLTALTVTGAITANGGIQTDGANTLKTKVIDIGDWDMATNASTTVAHGLTLANIRGITVIIRDDVPGYFYDFPAYDVAGSTFSYVRADATNIGLQRSNGGAFTGTGYDSTSYNRGWIIITYIA